MAQNDTVKTKRSDNRGTITTRELREALEAHRAGGREARSRVFEASRRRAKASRGGRRPES